jgi:hypothetical protein
MVENVIIYIWTEQLPPEENAADMCVPCITGQERQSAVSSPKIAVADLTLF